MTLIDRINPEMLVLARESRGLQQNELAREAGLAQGSLSKMERQELEISTELIKKIAKILDYPESHFYQSGFAIPPILSHKRKSKVPRKVLSRIDASVNIFRLAIEKLTENPSFKKFDKIQARSNPGEAAIELRRLWQVKEGVIENVVDLLERNGILPIAVDFNTDTLESRPILTLQKDPLLFFNRSLLGDRQRFTLAFELGHLVLHVFQSTNAESDMRHEANLFAAEFLMPKKEILQDFQEDITIDLLAKLKPKWKVSMQALLYRAHDLDRITDNQKRYLLTQFAQHGIKRREPSELDITQESPSLLRNLIAEFKSKHKLPEEGLTKVLHLSKNDLKQLQGIATDNENKGF